MRTRILNYLASGIKPAQVATIVGCSPGYISQLIGSEGFKQELETLVLEQPEDKEEKDLDNKYVSLEHNILKQIEDAIVGSELPALTRALEVVAKRQDMRFARKNPGHMQPNALGGANIAFITVSLPAHALPAPPIIELNSQREILAINSKPLAPMSSDGVKNLFSSLREAKQQQDTTINSEQNLSGTSALIIPEQQQIALADF